MTQDSNRPEFGDERRPASPPYEFCTSPHEFDGTITVVRIDDDENGPIAGEYERVYDGDWHVRVRLKHGGRLRHVGRYVSEERAFAAIVEHYLRDSKQGE